MLRRWKTSQAADDPAEIVRFGQARATVNEHAQNALTNATLSDIERALRIALDDRASLDVAIDQLDARSSTRELKAALRTRGNPLADDTPHIASLRRRHHAFHQLQTQRDQLGARIEALLVDVEALAATAVIAALDRGSAAQLDRDLAQVQDDLAALDAGHRAIEAIGRTGDES